MIPLKHQLSIDDKINPATGKPFGGKYAGTFVVRRPTLADKREIAMRDAATINAFGQVNQLQMDRDVININFIFANMDVIAEEKPAWFDPSLLFEGADEKAVYFVWSEVSRWLETFRSEDNPGTGGTGSQQA